MPALSSHRKMALVLLGLALAFPWCATAAPGREPAHQAAQPAAALRAPLDLAGRVWSVLTSLWDEEGCQIDPNGRCVASLAPAATGQTDTGCQIDPNGCRPAQAATATAPIDEGCHIDPNGCRLR